VILLVRILRLSRVFVRHFRCVMCRDLVGLGCCFAILAGTFQLLRVEVVRAFCDRACDSGASVWTFATSATSEHIPTSIKSITE
jgi:hypothetical protein